MKLVRWKRFTWELSKLPPFESTLPAHFNFRPATRDDRKTVSHLVVTSFSLDSAWSDMMKMFREQLDMLLEQAFDRESVPAIVVAHGPRIIAASVLNTDPGAESHLVSGPCVLSEYCNRGIGTALLHHSLSQLRSAGIEHASGATKDNVPACKFVYPKFGSSSTTFDYEPLVVRS
jgi:N-acetylglutamate synthase-like GNAT family acetyltransferase